MSEAARQLAEEILARDLDIDAEQATDIEAETLARALLAALDRAEVAERERDEARRALARARTMLDGDDLSLEANL